MSAEEADKTAAADASAGDEEEEWLYGDEGESKENEEEEAKLTAAIGGSTPTAPPDSEEVTANSVTPPTTTGNGVESQVSSQTPEETPGEDEDSESDSDDDDDDVRVTIGDIKTGAPQYTAYAAPVNLNIKTTGRAYGAVGTKGKGVDLEAPGSINGVPVLEVDMETFEEKPWRKPGADLSDYFNYGFNEETWKAYCEKQKKLRMGLDNLTMGSTTSKISVQQGRTGNTEKEITIQAHTSQADFSPSTMYKTGLNQVRMSPPRWQGPVGQEMPYYTKTSGTIDVIGGQTATISRVEGRRRHNLEGNNIQVISDHSTSEAEPAVAKMPPPFFPPGPLPPNMPPPPFLPPPVSQAPPLIPPPRIPITVPPPNFPPPTGGPPPSLIPTLDNGHPGGYDGRPVPPFPFPPGGFPPPMQGAVNPWPGMMDNSKPWDYYPRREKEREKERERDRPRERVHDRDHSPSSVAYNRTIVGASSGEQSSLKPTFSDEERYRYRDYGDRGYERHRERASREKEERHRERRHREKEEGRHKSSRSSSRRRHDSEEGDSHRRHKHKKSKRSKEGKEPSEERSGDQENQEAME